MKVQFEHNYQKKVMQQSFPELTNIASDKDVMQWRALWMAELKSWHSPYKALIDCTNLNIATGDERIKPAIDRLLKFFEGFYLKKAVGFGFDPVKGHEILPFTVHKDEAEALAEVGLAKTQTRAGSSDFRSVIHLQNHFKQHSVELTFSEPEAIDSKEKLNILRSKLSNNLMQWHSKWNLLVDCSNIKISSELHEDFKHMERFFKGLFLKKTVGYGSADKAGYPFEVYRARHKAAAVIEGEGNFSGDEADCKSRK